MKKKHSNSFESKILESIQVSDDVLKEAREELKKERERKFRSSCKILIPVMSCLLLCAIIVPILSFMLPQINKNSKEKDIYTIAELEKEAISSIKVYNQQEFKELLFADIEATNWLYGYRGNALFLQEIFTYDGIGCELYVVLSNDTEIKELSEYYSLSYSKFLCDMEIFYAVGKVTSLARFVYGNEYYCIEVKSPIEESLDEILEFILP